jgi:response regulator NasT
MPTRSLRIVIADDVPEMRTFLQRLLQRLGHSPITVENGRQLVEVCSKAEPDLIIADVKMPEMDGIEAAEQLSQRPVPIILVSGYHDAETLDRATTGNIMAYLVKPVEEADLKAAIAVSMARFQRIQEAEQETARLRQSLEERKLIERAKGTLMNRLGISEPEAFRRMRNYATHHNRKLVDIAQQITAAEETFQALDGQS